jgi:hypothetical protein
MSIDHDKRAEGVARANDLLIEALAILDMWDHPAAVYVDHAIATIGLRSDNEGLH